MAGRGVRLLAGVSLLLGTIAAPPVAQGGVPPTDSMVATRVAQVDPLHAGTVRGGLAGVGDNNEAFGVPGAADRGTSVRGALPESGNPAPRRSNLPHWLPQRVRAAVGPSSPSTLSAAPARATLAAPTAENTAPILAPLPAGLGLRSEFGSFGLSDADDSLLYPDCSASQLCEEPPDPSVAASATSIVQSVNELMLFVDRGTGDSRVLPNFDFFSLDNNQVTQSDPRVLYDASRDRWLATEISADCAHGYLHVAVSTSGDPFGVWTVYRLVFPGRIVDFPGLGTANDTVLVGLNAFGPDPESANCLAPGAFAGGMLVVMDWSDLVQNVASLSVTTTGPDPHLFTWRPATSTGGDPLARLVVAIDNGSDNTADVGYATVSGTNATRDVTVSPVVNLTTEQGLWPFETPPAPRQPGDPPTIKRAVDGDPTDAIATAGRLWFIATAPCTPVGDDAVRDCVRITELQTGVTPGAVSVISDSRLQETGMDLYTGGLGRATDGTLYAVYSRSSSTEIVAGWATWRGPTETAFHDPVLLIPGGGVYSGTRWGDYVILSPDPAKPDAVWQSHQVASADGTWFTWLSRLRPAPFGPLDGSFRINGGDAFAGETTVDLQFGNPPDVAATVVRVANGPALRDGVLVGGKTLPMADDLPWSLTVDEPGSAPGDGLRHVYVQWGDGLGHWSAVASGQITLDTTGPTIGTVAVPAIGTSTLVGRGSVPVSVRWGAGTDALIGLEGYDVEVRRDNRSWEHFATSSTALATGRVASGHPYQWRVRSFDRLGNVSDWAEGVAVRVDAIDDTSTTLHFDAGWRQAASAGAYRGGVHSTAAAGATASFAFTGRGFAIAATVGPGRGTLEVFVDGRLVGRFREEEPSSRTRRIGLARTQAVDLRAPAGSRHVVRLVAVDGRPVDIDAVILVR